MSCSPARLAANQKNAQKSTGPRTPEGKEKSRENALKHGLTGEGVVLTSRDASEVQMLSAELNTDFQPSNAASRVLLKRFAVLAVRLDRCVEYSDAMASKRIRDAGQAFNAARQAEVEALGAQISVTPAATVRALKETAEGIDWLMRAWLSVKADLDRNARNEWQRWHLDRMDYLTGRNRRDSPPSKFDTMARAGWGDFSGLPAEQGTLTRREIKTYARQQVAAMIDAEVAALRALDPSRDPEEEARDRAEATSRALYDPSPEAAQARKYEADAERGMHRALREFKKIEQHQAEAQAQAQAAPVAVPPAEPPPQDTSPPVPIAEEADDIVEILPTPAKTNPTTGDDEPAIGEPDESMDPGTTPDSA